MLCSEAKKYDNWCKEFPTVEYKDEEGNEYCIFHAPKGKRGISVDEFNKLVFERINKAKQKNEPCILSGTVFEGDIDFRQFNEDNPLPVINFSDVTFSGAVDFSGTTFSGDAFFMGATFSSVASFGGATFNGLAYFIKTTFSGVAYFMVTTFSGDANFGGSTFSNNAEFIQATFNRDTFFGGATFVRDASFRGSKFCENAEFSRATLSRDANFMMTIFSKNANFIKATFSGEADFRAATFSGEAYFFGETFIEGGDFKGLSIKKKVRLEGINLAKISFLDTDLRKIDFINCTWPKKLSNFKWFKKFSRNVLYDELNLFTPDERDDTVETSKEKNTFWTKLKYRLKQEWTGLKKDISFDKEKIKKVEILYRMSKQKYKEEHNESEVSNWHYGEKEMFRKGSRFRRFFPISLSNLYWLSSGYGERPFRAGVVLLSLILAISVLFGLTGLVSSNGSPFYDITEIKGWTDIKNFQNFWALFLNTLQYATFEKEPNFIPKTIYGDYLKLAVRILIPLQATLFALAVRNRFRR